MKRIILALCLAAMATTAHAETPAPMAGKPEDVGLSSAQLKRLEAVTKQNIDDGLMPGGTARSRGGRCRASARPIRTIR
jgi:hypothetical protein